MESKRPANMEAKEPAESHDCSNYPVTTCEWCEKAHHVYRWWKQVYDSNYDPIPLSQLETWILDAFFNFFDMIIEQLAEKAVTREDRQEIMDLYDVAELFLAELQRRKDTETIQRACLPGWRRPC